MDFPQEIFSPQKTLIEKGAVRRLSQEVAGFGKQGLIVHGRSLELSGRKDEIAKQFSGPLKADFFCRTRNKEPILQEITQIIEKARSVDARWIVGIGGGSVLDLAKAAAGLFNATETPAFYQAGGELKEKGIPFIAIPTTAGTGSEVTKNAVIINTQKNAKFSIRDDSFMARKVILDADLLYGLPKKIISYSAMDAFVQAHEAFISKNATWYSDSFALKAIQLIDKNIEPAYSTQTQESLSNLLVGSYYSGIAFSSSRLGVIHGIAHPLGVLYGYPHGLVCAVCFVPSVKLNKEVMGDKYDIMSSAIGMDLEKRVKELLDRLNISSPFKGEKIKEKEKIINETLRSGSTAANPKKIDSSDVEFILNEIFQS